MILVLLACHGSPDGANSDDTGVPADDTGAPYPIDTGPWSDGVVVPVGDLASSTWTGEHEAAAGTSIGLGDVDGTAGVDLVIGAPTFLNFESTGPLRGIAFIVNPRDTGEHALATETTLAGACDGSLDGLGTSLDARGDLDGDGYGDLVVGAPFYAYSSAPGAGAAYVLRGPVAGDLCVEHSDAMVIGAPLARAAIAVGVGTFAGDGTTDLGVVIPSLDVYPRVRGVVAIFDGGIEGERSVEDAATLLVAEDVDSFPSAFAEVGDTDGDGISDVAVGVYHYDSDNGRGYVVAGPLSGEMDLGDAATVVTGDEPLARLGISVAPGGDLDGDGRNDVVLGANEAGAEWEGALYVLTESGSIGTDDIAVTVRGEIPFDMMGSAASGADLDDDGQIDLAAAAPGNPYFSWSPGKVYGFLGPLDGPLDAADDAAWVLLGAAPAEGFGRACAVGDVDGDERDDLVVGAPFHSSIDLGTGRVYAVLGADLP